MTKENKYYVYQHLDFDGIIRYVGKGCGKRAWHVAKRDPAHKAWIEKATWDYVEIVEDNLSEHEAFRLENRLIREEDPVYNISGRRNY